MLVIGPRLMLWAERFIATIELRRMSKMIFLEFIDLKCGVPFWENFLNERIFWSMVAMARESNRGLVAPEFGR